jgi:hypothetical protein
MNCPYSGFRGSWQRGTGVSNILYRQLIHPATQLICRGAAVTHAGNALRLQPPVHLEDKIAR